MQFQRAPVSEIPETVETYDFSFARKEGDQTHPYGKFRWRLGGKEWLCDRMFGRVNLEGCDGETGHMQMRCRLQITEDGKAYFARA